MEKNINKWLIVLISIFFHFNLANVSYCLQWPIEGTYPEELESDYGPRNISSGSDFHEGIDFAASVNNASNSVYWDGRDNFGREISSWHVFL